MLERAMDEGVGSYQSFVDDMQTNRNPTERASDDEVLKAWTEANDSRTGLPTASMLNKKGRGVPPGLQAAIDKWGSEASGEGPAAEAARARLAKLTELNSSGEPQYSPDINAAASAALRRAYEVPEQLGTTQSVARDTVIAPPPKKGAR